MIPQSEQPWHGENPPTESWQNQMISAICSVEDLCSALELTADQLSLSTRAQDGFPLLVPRAFVDLMEKGNPRDPLLLQILHQREEDFHQPGFTDDPLDEHRFNPLPGVIHKYPGRVLLVVSGKCALNCRYCFRRNFPYDENTPGRADWRRIFRYLEEDSSLTEAILSGGDPLSAPDRHLAWITRNLEAVTHLKRLRIHTRLPVTIPERINGELLDWITGTRLQVHVVFHINHPHEIGENFRRAALKLHYRGIQCLNQSVLLKHINDDINTLVALQERSCEAGILPYYLFCLDRVQGATHFEVEPDRAIDLARQMRECLPGYLVPRLAMENPGAKSKSILV